MEIGQLAETSGIVIVCMGLIRVLELVLGKKVYESKENAEEGKVHSHLRKLEENITSEHRKLEDKVTAMHNDLKDRVGKVKEDTAELKLRIRYGQGSPRPGE